MALPAEEVSGVRHKEKIYSVYLSLPCAWALRLEPLVYGADQRRVHSPGRRLSPDSLLNEFAILQEELCNADITVTHNKHGILFHISAQDKGLAKFPICPDFLLTLWKQISCRSCRKSSSQVVFQTLMIEFHDPHGVS